MTAAAEQLRRIVSLDTTAQRLEIVALVRAWQRAWFEATGP